MALSSVVFAHNSDEWGTPPAVFAALDTEFHFVVDLAATRQNALCGDYYGLDHLDPARRDALAVPWANCVGFLNPPYSRVEAFVRYAAAATQHGSTIVCLIPSRTDTRWWHTCIYDTSRHQWAPGVEVRLLKGRLKFVGGASSAPFPSCVVIFRSATASGPVRTPLPRDLRASEPRLPFEEVDDE